MESVKGKTSTISAELRPLKLPEGIPDDELPKVILNVLLRRALFENNPLSKWILLGALEVLQGRSPKLTPTMLSQLVNLSHQSEEDNIPSKISMNKTLYNGKKTSTSIISESAAVQVNVFDKKKFVDKSSQIKILPKTKNTDSQCVEILNENKEIQCKPTVHTKWIQVKHPKLISNWAQTLIKEIKHNGTQTLQQNDVTNSLLTSPEDKRDSLKHVTTYKLPSPEDKRDSFRQKANYKLPSPEDKRDSLKQAITYRLPSPEDKTDSLKQAITYRLPSPEDKRDSLKQAITYRLPSPEDKRDSVKQITNYKPTYSEDKGDSLRRITNYKDILKPSWKLAEVDVISKQRRVKNAIHNYKMNETKSNKLSNMISSSLKHSPNDSIWDSSEDNLMFYGRPLIDKKSKIEFEIPVKSKNKLLDPRLQFLDY